MASELETYEMSIDEGRIVSERIAGGAWMNAHEAIAAITALESERDQWKARAESNKPPAGHVIDDQGVVRRVLGTLPVTADGCVVGMHARLHYFEEPYEQSHYPTDDSAFFDDITFMNDEVTGGSVLFSECYSTREAAEQARERGEK